MAQGNPITDVHGCPKHRDWQAIIPSTSSLTHPPDVVCYVPSHRTSWTFQLRADIISTPGIMCLEVNASFHPFLIFNVYNDIDNSAVKAMKTITNLLPRSIFLGDFNLHHPIWSRDNNLNKHSEEADELVQLFADNGYGILNRQGEETYFVHRTIQGHPPELYTSTLDLGWASSELHPFITDFKVANHLTNGSDHYPLVTTISYVPKDEPRQSFVFKEGKDGNQDDWEAAFTQELASRLPIPDVIETEDQFNAAVETLQDATLAASHSVCLRRPRGAKRAKW